METQLTRLQTFHQKMAELPNADLTKIKYSECDSLEAVKNLFGLRYTLVKEEFDEFVEAMDALKAAVTKAGDYQSRETLSLDIKHHLKDLLDAICDLNVVITGTAEVFGMDYDEAFTRVMDNNETKCGEGAHFRYDGKLMKPDGYVPVDISNLANEDAVSDHILSLL